MPVQNEKNKMEPEFCIALRVLVLDIFPTDVYFSQRDTVLAS